VLVAIAASTHRIRLGTVVAPIARRRIIKLARETVTLDRLSAGRLTLGLGLGGDGGCEFYVFGDPSEASERAQILDEGVLALTSLWSVASVHSTGRVKVDAVQVEPGPVQQPRIPVWFGCKGGSMRPVERAAAYDGIYPIEVDAIQVG
jgi:alkanesulfonate monooxygenase SsuD/methylene tetrahydromethanopterin reductase-like flavin-dependent oxidoreductase (luciferase family)